MTYTKLNEDFFDEIDSEEIQRNEMDDIIESKVRTLELSMTTYIDTEFNFFKKYRIEPLETYISNLFFLFSSSYIINRVKENMWYTVYKKDKHSQTDDFDVYDNLDRESAVKTAKWFYENKEYKNKAYRFDLNIKLELFFNDKKKSQKHFREFYRLYTAIYKLTYEYARSIHKMSSDIGYDYVDKYGNPSFNGLVTTYLVYFDGTPDELTKDRPVLKMIERPKLSNKSKKKINELKPGDIIYCTPDNQLVSQSSFKDTEYEPIGLVF